MQPVNTSAASQINHSEILEAIAEALRRAGDFVAEWQGKVKMERKKDGSPITQADREANEIICHVLTEKFPEIGFLSEEGLSRDIEKELVFAVDPLDGTKEYAQGRDDFAISIGLLFQGNPVAGGIYVVKKEKLFLGSLQTGASINGTPIRLKGGPCQKIAVSRTETKKGVIQQYPLIQERAVPVGSIAVKLTMLLENTVQGYCSFFPKGIWDLAAGHALLEAAGGKLLNTKGEAIKYNLRERICREGLIAGHPEVIPFLVQAVQKRA